MYIKEIILDGFKSYAHRTVIDGFDPSFNAITGPNGSGKSNLLDAICFVLGISVLSQVRTTSLQGLIYNKGQAGVTKASVTIVFDNTSKEEGQCPMGYESFDEITVTRQIVMGGRNKYLINGKVAQQNTVQNLFQSVQLNINNPHFLIMQGRITKVINMKPPEVLGMLEESAGTRMFEMKKIEAHRTMEKKDRKLEEINQVMNDEIAPKLKRLQKQREEYELFCKSKVEIDRLHRYVVAGNYYKGQEDLSKGREKLKNAEIRADTCRDELSSVEHEKKRVIDKIKKLKEQLANEKKMQTANLEKEEQELNHQLLQINVRVDNYQKEIDTETHRLHEINSTLNELQKALKDKTKQKDQAQKAFDNAKEKLEQATQQWNQSTNQLSLLKAGVAAGDGGKSYAEMMSDITTKLSRAETESKEFQLRLNHLQRTLKEKQKESSKQDEQYSKLTSDQERLKGSIQTLEKTLTGIPYKSDLERGLQDRLVAATKKERELIQEVRMMESSLANLQLEYRDPWSGFDRSSVKGMVAQLIEVKDPETATALEVVAGGRLYNVVVDSEETGKGLLDHGQLKKRITIIPLNKIQSRQPSNNQMKNAQSISNGTAHLALQLVGYDKELHAAMQYVFGATFVCSDIESAQKLAYSSEVGYRCVTLEGNEYSPAGTMTGGSKGNLGQCLSSIQALNEKRSEVKQIHVEIEEIKKKLHEVTSTKDQYTKVQRQLTAQQTEWDQLQHRLQKCDHQQILSECASMEEEISVVSEKLKETKSLCAELSVKRSELEAEMKTFTGGQDKIAKVEKDIEKHKRKIEETKPVVREKEELLQTLDYELRQQDREHKEVINKRQSQEEVLQQCEKDKNEIIQQRDKIKEKWTISKQKLDEVNQKLQQTDHNLAQYQADEDLYTQRESALTIELKSVEHNIKQLKREMQGTEEYVSHLEKENTWMASYKHQFGVIGGEFDFTKRPIRDANKDLEILKEEQKDRQKNVNQKALSMLESVEQEYNDLMTKRAQVEKDKDTIEKVIEELDIKKKAQLHETFQKVTTEFSSIFSTMLPGAMAKLQAIQDEEGSLTGLEVMVGFNGQWKESLSELSGGQRSLLALSLILSLLVFKPAPMYILDEVDAALDLANTQNIGKMLKKHFARSQFILVSLKEEMFKHANVVFKAKAHNHQSSVTRIVNHQSY